MCGPDKSVSTCLCLGKHYNCFLVILPDFAKQIIGSEMYFHVPVCDDLIRVLAHACAWENNKIASSFAKQIIGCEMYFHVPVCADLIRVLAHACAWENITITSL